MLYECMYLFIYLYTYTIGFCTTEEVGSSKELMSGWGKSRKKKQHWTASSLNSTFKNLMMRFFINLFNNFNFLLNIIKYIENQQRHFFHLNSQHHRTLITLPTTVEQYWRRSWYNNKNSPKSFLVVYASNIKDNDPQVIIIICTYNVNIINNDKYAD